MAKVTITPRQLVLITNLLVDTFKVKEVRYERIVADTVRFHVVGKRTQSSQHLVNVMHDICEGFDLQYRLEQQITHQIKLVVHR